MKKYTFYFICFLMAVAVTSCKKEKEEDSFLKGQMTDFHGQKAYIDGSNYSCFRQGETIFVNGRNNCTVSALSNSDRTCTISGAEEASVYYAFYPANMISATDISSGFSNATVTLPRVQQYAEENGHQVIDNPMAGHLNTSSGTIQFNNLCAVLKLNVFTNGTLDSISVRCPGATLFGSGTVDASTWKLNMDANQTGKDSIVLLFPNRRAGNVYGESYYIVVPEATLTVGSDAVVVRIFGTGIADNTATRMKRFGMTIPTGGNTLLAYNKIHNFANFCFGRVEYNNKCKFTVNAQGKKVTFASGNLVHVKESGLWHFPGKPYHNVDAADYDYFFGYGTSGWNSGAVSYLPGTISTSYADYSNYYIGNSSSNSLTGAYAEADWGWHNTIVYSSGKSSPPHTWRTPTSAEWNYILQTRSGNRFAKARVNRVTGLIIFPDNYNGNTSGDGIAAINSTSADYPSSFMTEPTWNTFESNGCVFLPAHGFRVTGSDPSSWDAFYSHGSKPGDNENKNGQAGFYAAADRWTGGAQTYDISAVPGAPAAQSYPESAYASCMKFRKPSPGPYCPYLGGTNGSGYVGTHFVLRNEGVNVRLVHDIN
jgi:hypothetical protein